MVTSLAEHSEYLRSLKNKGETKYLTHENPLMQPKTFELYALEFSDVAGDPEIFGTPEGIVFGPQFLNSCVAYSFDGAYEFFRHTIIDDVSYMGNTSKARVFVSELKDTDNPAIKLLVATTSKPEIMKSFVDNCDKIIKEFIIVDQSKIDIVAGISVERQIEPD